MLVDQNRSTLAADHEFNKALRGAIFDFWFLIFDWEKDPLGDFRVWSLEFRLREEI
jgi:hypothetical protein